MKKLHYLTTIYGLIALFIFIVSLLIGHSDWISVLFAVLCFYGSLSDIEGFFNKNYAYTCVALSKTILADESWEKRRKYFLIDLSLMGFLSLLFAIKPLLS